MDFLILVLRNNYKGSISIAPHIIYLEKLACIFTFIRKELVEGFADQSCAISDMIIFIIQVLHMDRNDYYGGESTSLNLFQVCSRNALVAGFFFLFCDYRVLHSYLLFQVSYGTNCSYGRSLRTVISPQRIWAPAGTTMWIWSQR